MTIKDLEKYRNMKLELQSLIDEKKEIEKLYISSPTFETISASNMKNSSVERYTFKLETINEKIKLKQESLIEELNIIEDFLASVKDLEIRVIIRKRFIECKSWTSIGEELFIDRTTPYYKLISYLNKKIEGDKISENINTK